MTALLLVRFCWESQNVTLNKRSLICQFKTERSAVSALFKGQTFSAVTKILCMNEHKMKYWATFYFIASSLTGDTYTAFTTTKVESALSGSSCCWNIFPFYCTNPNKWCNPNAGSFAGLQCHLSLNWSLTVYITSIFINTAKWTQLRPHFILSSHSLPLRSHGNVQARKISVF